MSDPRQSGRAVHTQADQMIGPGLSERDHSRTVARRGGAACGARGAHHPDTRRVREITQPRGHAPQGTNSEPFFWRRNPHQLHARRRIGRHAVEPVRAARPGRQADGRRPPSESGELTEDARDLRRARPVHRRHFPGHRQQPPHAVAGRAARAETATHFFQPLDRAPRMLTPGVARHGFLPGGGAERKAQLGIVDQLLQTVGEGVHVARLDQPGGPAMIEHLANLLEIGGDDALPHRHVLEQLGRRSEKRRAVWVRHVRRRRGYRTRRDTRGLPAATSPVNTVASSAPPSQDPAHGGHGPPSPIIRSRTARARAGSPPGACTNACARTSAPCQGPNVPMKPTTIVPPRPNRSRIGPPSTAGR